MMEIGTAAILTSCPRRWKIIECLITKHENVATVSHNFAILAHLYRSTNVSLSKPMKGRRKCPSQ
jgi:hypothetical protein